MSLVGEPRLARLSIFPKRENGRIIISFNCASPWSEPRKAASPTHPLTSPRPKAAGPLTSPRSPPLSGRGHIIGERSFKSKKVQTMRLCLPLADARPLPQRSY